MVCLLSIKKSRHPFISLSECIKQLRAQCPGAGCVRVGPALRARNESGATMAAAGAVAAAGGDSRSVPYVVPRAALGDYVLALTWIVVSAAKNDFELVHYTTPLTATRTFTPSHTNNAQRRRRGRKPPPPYPD